MGELENLDILGVPFDANLTFEKHVSRGLSPKRWVSYAVGKWEVSICINDCL